MLYQFSKKENITEYDEILTAFNNTALLDWFLAALALWHLVGHGLRYHATFLAWLTGLAFRLNCWLADFLAHGFLFRFLHSLGDHLALLLVFVCANLLQCLRAVFVTAS